LAIARIRRISRLGIACQSQRRLGRISLFTGNAIRPSLGRLAASRQLLEQTESTGTLGRPAPAVNLKLGVDMPDVSFNRVHRQVKLIADFP
jgi:hypothetical protein